MLHKVLTTSQKKELIINSDEPNIIEHFNDGRNYTDTIIRQINEENIYQYMFKGKDLVVVDIGANVGLFSLYAQDSASVVYSVEPTPSHFAILESLTGPYKNIQPINAALSDNDSDVDFYISDSNSTMNSIANVYGKKISVKGVCLESLLKDIPYVDFIKCDIEGSEMIALTRETVAPVASKVKAWCIEVHATAQGGIEENRGHISNIFSDLGYVVKYFSVDGVFAYHATI